MSSRAVRKALKQREAEEAQLNAKAAASATHGNVAGGGDEEAGRVEGEGEGEEEDEEEEEETLSIPPGKPNLFAMLGGEEDGDEEEDEDEDNEEPSKATTTISTSAPSTSKSKKKKKNKNKNKKKPGTDKEDEIDRALRLLNLKDSTGKAPSSTSQSSTQKTTTATDTDLLTLLKIDTRSLDASQEMRRLFGRAAITGDHTPEEGPQVPHGRRGGRGGAVPQGGRGMMLKKGVFVQPKASWPNAGSGGLGMEVVKEVVDGSEFKFVHGRGYQDVQRQFMMCVMSMDPNRMQALLQHNPYHISTLLQVSEIATHQREHTISGDLLERALFTFGRALHSTFSPLLTSPSFNSSSPASSTSFGGIKHPQLSFSYFSNREFYLTIWRYIHNLTLRGTFRTASEYARLLFLLSPKRDPYAMLLYLPVLLLKAHQPNFVISLATSPALKPQTKDLPGVAYSLALAYLQLDNAIVAQEYLAKAIRKFPWVLSRLWQALDLDSSNLPATLWGRIPPEDTPLHAIVTELYVERARDLWNTPDASKLLIDTTNNIYNLPDHITANSYTPEGADTDDEIDGVPANVARHVILSDIPAVTTLLPLGWKNRVTTGYDPLPPIDDVEEYDMFAGVAGMEAPLDPGALAGFDGDGDGGGEAGMGGVGGTMLQLFRTLLPWVATPHSGANAGADSPAAGEPRSPQDAIAAAAQGRYEPDWDAMAGFLGVEGAQRMREMVEARGRAGALAGGVGVDGVGAEGGVPTGAEEGEGEAFMREVVRMLVEQERGELRGGGVDERGEREGEGQGGQGGEEEWEVWPEGTGGAVRGLGEEEGR